jgi:hypothetical protein
VVVEQLSKGRGYVRMIFRKEQGRPCSAHAAVWSLDDYNPELAQL